MLLAALIDESRCIGCTLCLIACPHDAIMGANQVMHSVLTEECTGCGECVAPCPMHCIELVDTGLERLSPEREEKAAQRATAKKTRLSRQLLGQKATLSELLYLEATEEEREANFQASIEKALKHAQNKKPFTWPKGI